jgi:hypothetical protein
MAAAEDFMGVVVTSQEVVLVAVAMDGVVVTGEVGTVVAGLDGAGSVVGMAVVGTGAVGMVVVPIGMAVLPIGGGVTHTRMDTGLMVGKSDKHQNQNQLRMNADLRDE